jgi:glycosyltransferase involved in cell wall biosynthesis
MKVCHFAATKGIGRGEAFVEIANGMSKKVETHLLVPDDSLFRQNLSCGVNFNGFASKGSRNNPVLLFEVFRYFKSNNFDVVHTHFAKATQIFSRINRFIGIPHIATKHNPRPSRAFKGIRHVTVVSQQAVSSVANKSYPIKVIPNGISVDSRSFDSDVIPKCPFEILAIGRLDPIKGFDLLIEKLSGLQFDFFLSIAGDGPERNRLETLARQKLGVGKFRFLGFRHDIESLIRNSHLVVSSSYSEGCPIVLLEALFCANLFISTPVGEAAEILPRSFLAESHEIGDKIKEAYSNYEIMRKEFRELADRIKDNYSTPVIVDRYLDAYDSVIKDVPFI